jgi:murein L,D-transpeptidase YcbB/YkuD
MIARFAFGLALAAASVGGANPLAAEEKPAPASEPAGGLAATSDSSAPDALTPPEQKVTPGAQEKKSIPASAPVVGLDATPDKSAPDPLTPPEQKVTPLAPGAQEEKPAEHTKAPEAEPDPFAKAILAKLASAGGKGDAHEDVAGLSEFYKQRDGRPIWTGATGFTAQAKNAIRELRAADEWGLDASAFQIPAEPKPGATAETRADAEIKLSLAVLKYARHARGGRLDPPSLSEAIDRRPRIYQPKSVLQAISTADAADAYLRGLHPKHEQFKRLRQALLTLKKGSPGGSSFLIPAGPDLRPGDEHPQIALIKRRLGIGGDDMTYNRALYRAVARFQADHGMEPNGIVDRRLRALLNGPDQGGGGGGSGGGAGEEQRMRILVNMERWRWMPDSLGDFYVWDSITEQLARVFDHGKVVLTEKIVVGKPETPTPSFSANMQFIVFHPEWNVPDGIKVGELAPKLRAAAGGGGGGESFFMFNGGGGMSANEILERYKLIPKVNGHPVDADSVDWSRVDIRRFQFVQPPGPANVLGVVKFRFPNKHDIYMHDTPERNLFGAVPRAFSHGCMRTQNPIHLAEVLLAHDKGYSASRVRQLLEEDMTNEIRLSTEIPVHIVYFTAEVDDDGKLRFLPDIYGLDSRIASALKGQPVRLPSAPVVAENAGRSRAREDDSDYYREDGDRGYRDPYGDPYRPYASGRRREWNYFDWN